MYEDAMMDGQESQPSSGSHCFPGLAAGALLWASGPSRRQGSGSSPCGPLGGGFGGGFPPFPPFPGFPWSWFRRGTRAKRGDVRAAILVLLAEKPTNGYQIMQELEQRSRGAWKPSPGAVYPALAQLEDEGLVRAEVTNSGRLYHLTEQGTAYVESHRDTLSTPWESAGQGEGDESVLGLFGELKHIAGAALQVAHTGSLAQIAEAQKLLNQTRRALYRLLAEDAPEDDE
jgi:DNA-binding PadR family transcriptional regulator